MQQASRLRAAGKAASFGAEIGKMCFLFGDVRSPLDETLVIVEQTVHAQLAAVVDQCLHLGSLSLEHVLFLFRDDAQRQYRIHDFMEWKDNRAAAEEGEENEGDDGDDAAEEADTVARLPVSDFLTALELDAGIGDAVTAKAEALRTDKLRRHALAAQLTETMTTDEYLEYAALRQASFTYKKGKKFRDWLGISGLADSDTTDVLGFLAWEMVGLLVQASLAVRREFQSGDAAPEFAARPLRFQPDRIFDCPWQPDAREPLLPVHVREAARRI